jgi:DNA-binding response OmpR family regulator
VKILIIEDQESQCRFYREELEDEGYDVICAQTSDEGMELFKRDKPDLVTLDINLSASEPEGGIKLLRYMKEIRPKIPIIMHTAYCLYKDDFEVWCADAYIVKSSDMRELKSAIKKLLSISSESPHT